MFVIFPCQPLFFPVQWYTLFLSTVPYFVCQLLFERIHSRNQFLSVVPCFGGSRLNSYPFYCSLYLHFLKCFYLLFFSYFLLSLILFPFVSPFSIAFLFVYIIYMYTYRRVSCLKKCIFIASINFKHLDTLRTYSAPLFAVYFISIICLFFLFIFVVSFLPIFIYVSALINFFVSFSSLKGIDYILNNSSAD